MAFLCKWEIQIGGFHSFLASSLEKNRWNHTGIHSKCILMNTVLLKLNFYGKNTLMGVLTQREG